MGTTGEANSLSVAQRLALIEAAASGGVPLGKCIFGSGSCALADAVTVTKAALAAGAGGALLLPPFYYKNPSEDGLFAFFSEVVQRVGDARLRLYLYHIPAALDRADPGRAGGAAEACLRRRHRRAQGQLGRLADDGNVP